MAGEDRECAVDLFCHDEASEGMGHREGAEGEQQLCARACRVGPAVGGADGEDDVLSACVATFPKPGSEGFGCDLAAAGVEKDGDSGDSAVLALEPFK